MAYDFSVDQIRNRPVAVIGGGTLGRRIALMTASRGGVVRISDPNAEVARAAVQYVQDTLPGVLKIRGSGDTGRVVAVSSLEEALQDSRLVIEAVPERRDIKIPLWGQVDRLAPVDAGFATNSCPYASRLMNEQNGDRSRFCNLHFSMPPVSNAADLMSDGETAREVPDTLLRVLPEFDVHPFEAQRESTGFIFNRVWAAIKRESLAVVADGVARPEDVDAMFRLNWRIPAGPFQMMDSVGLDLVLDIEDHYAPRIHTCPRPPDGCCTSTSTPESRGARAAKASTVTSSERAPGSRAGCFRPRMRPEVGQIMQKSLKTRGICHLTPSVLVSFRTVVPARTAW